MNPSASQQPVHSGNDNADDDDTASRAKIELLDEIASKKVPSIGFPNHDCKTGHNIDLLRAFVPGESFAKRHVDLLFTALNR